MKNILNFKTIFLSVILCAGLFVSCKDEGLFGGPDRLFRPIVKAPFVSMTSFQISWDRYTGAKSYELNLSVDSFKTVLRNNRTDSTQFTFTNLNYDTKYQIRIRAFGDSILANGDTIKSEYYIIPDVTTKDYPTKLLTPTSSDIIDNSIRMNWALTSAVYTRFDIAVKRDSVVESVNLTATDNKAGVKIIKGLQPATTYYVKIYQGDVYMGKKVVKTAAAQIFTGDVVDLRVFSDEKSKTILTQAFVDSIGTAHPSGLNLILSGGTTYTIPTLLIPVSMNIVTGLSFNGKAIMYINGNFAVSPARDLDQVRFEKVFFTEGNIAGKLKTDGNYGATYLFNFNQSGGNVKNLILESCDIKYKRGVIRMQTAATIGTVTFNNCLCDSVGGYGVINNGSATSRINDIFVSNSTFAHCDKLFVGGAALGINSITIKNITTYCTPIASGYFLDYNTNLVPGGVSITNSIFGPGFTAATATAPIIVGTAVNGMRLSTVTPPSVTISSCYKTSDLVWALKVDGTPNLPITDFVDLGSTSTSIFGGVTTGNFTVKDDRLVKKAGDPRWW